jgi:hypothetical protein
VQDYLIGQLDRLLTENKGHGKNKLSQNWCMIEPT